MKIKNVFTVKALSAMVVAGIALLASCSKNNDAGSVLSASDSQNVNSESVSASVSDESTDMGSTVVNNTNDTQLSGARVAATEVDWTGLDGRLKGATITITPNGNSTFSIPQGTITIDFGSGQTDNNGVVRKGVITITYYGRRYQTGSYRIFSYSGYSRTAGSNTITFDDAMTYTVTNVTDSTLNPIKFHHVLANGKFTFSSDNTFITRNVDHVVAWDKSALTMTIDAKSKDAIVTSPHSAWGTNRKGVAYTMDITTDLVRKASCLSTGVTIPVSGVKAFTVGNNTQITYTLDYGDGTCDNTVSITLNGKTKTITVSSNGN
jgi:hypothetical protein